MAKKKRWIKAAIKHPGRMQRRAEEHGVSTHEQMVRDKSSDDPSLSAAANLGLRLSKMSKS
jgi:hypothetical protein